MSSTSGRKHPFRDFTTPAPANMGYAMLRGVMNLGGWIGKDFKSKAD